MNEIKPFRFWCQKVLPLVYDDSLSYYEQLCKVVSYLNDTIENVNLLGNDFVNLQKYVDNYFNSLDIQAEIDNKLDSMVTDGTFDRIINEQVFGELNTKVDSLLYDKKVNNFIVKMSEKNKKCLMLGDSIAYGTGWNGSKGIFTIFENLFTGNTFTNIAIPGATLCTEANLTANAKTQFDSIDKNTVYDYIFVLMGINDITASINAKKSYMGNFPNPIENPTENTWSTAYDALSSLLASLKTTYNNANIYYITPPSAGYNHNLYTSAYNTYKNICKNVGVKVIDLYAVFPNYQYASSHYLYFDHFHPNEAGYRYMAQTVVEAINDNSPYYTPYAETPLVFTDADLGSFNKLSSFKDMIFEGRKICINLVKTFKQNYSNLNCILTNGSDAFVSCNIENIYATKAFYISIFGGRTYSYKVRFKVTIDDSETINVAYQGIDFLNVQEDLSNLGITNVKDIPFTGTFQTQGTKLKDLPSEITDGRLIHITNFAWNYVDSNTVAYERTALVKAYNSNILYVFHSLYNGSITWEKQYKIPMTEIS